MDLVKSLEYERRVFLEPPGAATLSSNPAYSRHHPASLSHSSNQTSDDPFGDTALDSSDPDVWKPPPSKEVLSPGSSRRALGTHNHNGTKSRGASTGMGQISGGGEKGRGGGMMGARVSPSPVTPMGKRETSAGGGMGMSGSAARPGSAGVTGGRSRLASGVAGGGTGGRSSAVMGGQSGERGGTGEVMTPTVLHRRTALGDAGLHSTGSSSKGGRRASVAGPAAGHSSNSKARNGTDSANASVSEREEQVTSE